LSLSKTFDKLRKDLYTPLIFFVPKSIIPEDKKTLLEDSELKHLFNKVVIVKNDGAGYELKDQPVLIRIMQKEERMDQLVFDLLDIKESINQTQFNFLFEKYCEHLNLYLHISEWFTKNLKANIDNVTDELESAFQLQYEIFAKHFEKLKVHLLITEQDKPTKTINTVELIESHFSDLKKYVSEHVVTDTPTIDIANTEAQETSNKKPIKKAKNKKESLISDKQSESFLLETVFGVGAL